VPKLIKLDNWFAPADKVRLAINLFDLDKISPFIRDQMGLASKLDAAGGAIKVDADRPDETAVAFSCDALAAACLLDVIRQHDRSAGDRPCRAYANRGRGWTKLPADAVLTEARDGKLRLNPSLFGGGEVAAPPQAERVF